MFDDSNYYYYCQLAFICYPSPTYLFVLLSYYQLSSSGFIVETYLFYLPFWVHAINFINSYFSFTLINVNLTMTSCCSKVVIFNVLFGIVIH